MSQLSRDELRHEFGLLCEQSELNLEVFSDGPTNASIAIIGEGPGETELRQGLPFVGASGRLMWDALRKHGLHRANVYSTNVVKRQISLGKTGNEKHVVYADELEKWTGLLQWEISQLHSVRIIFVLGNYALQAICNQAKIMDWRGSVLDNYKLPNNQVGKIVVSINPAYAMRELKYEPIFMMDCGKLNAVAKNIWKPYEIETLINPTYRQAMQSLADIKKANKPTTHDIESINGETACLGLANDPHYSVCINFRDATENRYSLQEEADIRLAYQDLCDSHQEADVPRICQRGVFDAYWLRLRDHICLTPSDDTLLQHHTLYPQLPHSLAFICAQYTNHPFYKDEGKNWREGGDIDTFWRYNGKDTCITLAAWSKMNKELEQQGLLNFYRNHVMRAQPHLISATVHGVAVDLDRKKKVIEIVSKEVEEAKQEFWRLVEEVTEDPDYRPNPASPKQMKELWFSRLKLKGRGYSTDANNRKHMFKNPETSPLCKEIISTVNRYAKEEKFLGTYAESRVSADGRFRCEYNQAGVINAPGRLSSSSLINGEGSNLQNQPERAKEMFVADPDTVFCYFDLSQAEARVVAYRADIPLWKEQFERARIDGKYDCHRALASEMFRIPYDEVPLKDFILDANGRPQFTVRYIAKRCRHGLNYRMERFRLSEVTGLPYHEAARNFAIYHRINPQLEKWWAQAEREFRDTRECWNAMGRRWKVIQRIDDEVLGSVVAYYPQSTIGDKVVQVWYKAEEDDAWPIDARVALNVHDSLTGLVIGKEKTIKTALSILKKYAEEPIMVQDAWRRRPPEPLIIPAECKVSYPCVYDEAKKKFVKAPTGKGIHRWSNMETIDL
jgi:uracil-DNA glycosylase family 4